MPLQGPSGWSTRLLDALNAIPQRTSKAFINSLKRIEELEDALKKPGLDDSQQRAIVAQLEAAKEQCGNLREQMKFADRK
jgi:hypothetical protein